MTNVAVHELTVAIRRLWSVRGFAAATIAVIATGIGAATFVFSVVNTMLLRSLPYERPATLAVVTPVVPLAYWSVVDQLREETSLFDGVGAYTVRAVNMSANGRAERVLAARATSAFFSVTGVRAAIGRDFRPEEFQPAHDKVALLTDALWRRQYQGGRHATGRTVILDGESYTIVGVLAPDFRTIAEMAPAHQVSFNTTVGLVVPLAGRPSPLGGDNAEGPRGISIIARLRQGVPLGRAQNVVGAVTRRTIPSAPFSFSLVTLREAVAGELPRKLALLAVAVCLLLLVACANEASLLVVRLHARRRELAVRVALGATSRHLVCTVLMETMLLAIAGAVGGLLIAWAGIVVTRTLAAPMVTRVGDLRVSLPLVAFAVALAVGTTLLVSVLPAIRVASTPGRLALHGEPPMNRIGRRLGVPSLLVATQVALSVLLVVGGLLLAQDFARSVRASLGYRTEGILTAEISLNRARYRPTAAIAFFRRLLESAVRLPGVDRVAVSDVIPGGEFSSNTMTSVGPRPPEIVPLQAVSEDYFSLLSIPLLAGRSFTAGDRGNAAQVVVVNDRFAEKYWGSPASALDQEVSFGPQKARVVGVVASVRWLVPGPAMYMSYSQSLYPPGPVQMTVLVHVRGGDASAVGPSLRRVAAEIDSDQPLYNMLTLDRIARAPFARSQLMLAAMSAFADLTLLLAALGVYGMMTYATALRRREVALRLAVGATTREIVGLMFRRAFTVVGSGIAVGLPVIVAVTLFVQSTVFDFAGADLTVCSAAVGLVFTAGLLASLLPVLRAAHTDPITTLRSE